jgi:hypothetical protein
LDTAITVFSIPSRICSIPHTSANRWVKMGRELVWLENSSFAAWGCSACAWIVPNPGATVSGKPPASVKDAFDKHECARFPRASDVTLPPVNRAATRLPL